MHYFLFYHFFLNFFHWYFCQNFYSYLSIHFNISIKSIHLFIIDIHSWIKQIFLKIFFVFLIVFLNKKEKKNLLGKNHYKKIKIALDLQNIYI